LLWFVLGRPGQKFWRRIRNIRLLKKSAKLSSAKTRNKVVDGISTRRVYKLHGSFQMLTEDYISRIGYLDEDLFMFGEEDLIAWNCELHGLSRVLNDSSCISHQNDSSIESAHEERASQFVVEQEEKSAIVLRAKINMIKLFFICVSRSKKA
jgi:GT2 family glycosyltransferase